MTRCALAVALCLTLSLTACLRVEEGPAPTAEPSDTTQTIALGPHTVQCGCSIESVGHCGNYIEIDGAFVEIANSAELGLGGMAWCGQPPQQAQAAGTVDADGFTATTLNVGS